MNLFRKKSDSIKFLKRTSVNMINNSLQKDGDKNTNSIFNKN